MRERETQKQKGERWRKSVIKRHAESGRWKQKEKETEGYWEREEKERQEDREREREKRGVMCPVAIYFCILEPPDKSIWKTSYNHSYVRGFFSKDIQCFRLSLHLRHT
jgi:hypothetical protein